MIDHTFLSSTVLFHGIDSSEMELCLKTLNSYEKKYKKGEFILHAGNSTNEMGIVYEGSLSIESNDIWGNCTVLNVIRKGGFFAESYAINAGEILAVDVKANSDSDIIFLDLRPVKSRTFTNKPWTAKFLSNLLIISTRKNLALSSRSFHNAPKTIRGKLLSYLNFVSIKKGISEFDIPFNRQQLADYLNVDRTNLSKEISLMKSERLIDCKKNHFKLFNM